MNYYPHHIGDFNNATRHLTRIERSIYRDMIEMYYDTEQPLTLDMPALCRKLLARTSDESTAVEQVLNEFFTRTESGWYHNRCEVVIADYHKNISDKSAAGKASAAKRERERLEKLNIRSTPVEVQGIGSSSDEQLTKNQEPKTSNQKPVTSNQEPKEELKKPKQEQTFAPAGANAGKKSMAPKDEPNPLNMETWNFYKQAYTQRYGVAPVRDVAVNSKIKAIVRSLGAEAPAVAEFFVSHNGSRYVAGMHQIGFLATDYAKLRTEWATNSRMTQTKALQADKTATNLDAFAPLIAAAKAKEEAERNANAE